MSTPPTPSRCWTLVTEDGAVDVEVTARDDERLAALRPALAAAVGAPAGLFSGCTSLPDGLALTDPALAHGAVLGVGRPAPGTAPDRGPSVLELHVVGGPAAGTTVPLARGRHVLGRGAGATVRLDDPDVSRRHVVVQVGTGEIAVSDLGSTNGSRLDGVALDARPRSWPVGTALRIGSSTLVPASPGHAPAGVDPAPGGRLRLRLPAALPAPAPAAEVALPPPPDLPARRRLGWVAVALPAVGGLLVAWLLDAPYVLLFAVLGPLVAVGTWLSDCWSGRRGRRRATAAHAADLARASQRLAEAVRADLHAVELTHPDLAGLAAAARRRSTLLWRRRAGDAGALTVRIGTGPGNTRVVRVEEDGRRAPEPAEHLPVVVDLAATGGLAAVGPRPLVLGVLRGVVAQLATLLPAGDADLVLVTDPDRLADWTWLRWLPHLRAVAAEEASSAARAGGTGVGGERTDGLPAWLLPLLERRPEAGARRADADGPGRGRPVLLVDRPADHTLAAALVRARRAGGVVLTSAPSAEQLPVAVDAVLDLTGGSGSGATLARAGAASRPEVTIDRLPGEVAASLARDLAALAPPAAGAALPRSLRLVDLPASGLGLHPDGTLAGQWSRSRSALVAVLGRTAQGDATVDLCRQGPHALVAGTTGAGKSELLRTLVASLALHHPPDRCSFLLVDYKGGAAFAEAAALPHTVGLLTDLDGRTTARALRSLTAELTRREALLARHRTADLAALPDEVDLARLVIVVDEFAGLAEELPSFVPGLVGIAQRGRSLGVHLVLATQRPSGVVSPEIRANCTLRICLRTTDEADSRDVLGGSEAALLPVDVPGRGYVRVGGGPAVAVQVARVGGGPALLPVGPRVRRWEWPDAEAGRASAPAGASGAASDLAGICAALLRRAGESGVRPPHRPWRPVLPDRVTAADLATAATGEVRQAGGPGVPSRVRIGLLDRPETQSQHPVELDLRRGGGWLAIGGPRSGRTTFLRTVLAEAVAALPPEELHVHVLDHGGGALATAAGTLPHTGTAVGGGDPLRAVRLLDRLGAEVASRRAGATSRGPLLLLLVDGVEALTGQLDEADPGRGSAALLRLVRDGAAVGLTCLLTGDRAVPGGRLTAAVDVRLVLPLADRADYALAGIPPSAVPEQRPPGRALLGDAFLECQLALPRERVVPAAGAAAGPAGPRPLVIPDLAPDPVVPLPRGPAVAGRAGPLRLPLGPGGDEGTVLEVDLRDTGGLLVAGAAGSGRSSALAAFARHLAAAGVPVLSVTDPDPDPERETAGGRAATWLAGGDVAGWHAWLAALAAAPGAVVVDDHGASADGAVLTAIAAGGLPPTVVLLVAGTPAELSAVHLGPVAGLRRRRSALLLRPGPGDAELLGVRLPRTPVADRPGSGWLLTGGLPQRVQVARRRDPDRSAPGEEAAGPGRAA